MFSYIISISIMTTDLSPTTAKEFETELRDYEDSGDEVLQDKGESE